LYLLKLWQNGYGTQQNKVEAIKWYRLVAAKGDARSNEALKRLGIQ